MERRLNQMAEAPLDETLDGFLSGISARAYRFAELGLRHREDALDVVQEAMLKMLNYRDRPAEEWSPLFWRILRTRIIDAQRRRRFRVGWMGSAPICGRWRLMDISSMWTPRTSRR